MSRHSATWTVVCAVAFAGIASASTVPLVAPPSETFEPYVLYSDTTVTIEAEGERFEVHNLGRCFVRPFHPAGAPRPNAQFFPNGSVPAVKLPSGAVLLIGIAANGQARLDPCWGLRNENLMTFDPPAEPLVIAHVGPLRQGSVGSVNLERTFARRERLFAAWIDNAAEPTEIVGYLDEGLLNNPEAKFRLIDIKVRLLSEEEWGNRDATRIEDTVPWIAKYCSTRETQEPRSDDLGRAWRAPYSAIVSLDALPDGPLRQRLEDLPFGVHKIELAEIADIGEWRAVAGALPLHSFSWLEDDRVLLDLRNRPPNDTLEFHPNLASPRHAIKVVIGGHEIVRTPQQDDGAYQYDADTESLLHVGVASYLEATQLCTKIEDEPQ